MFLKTPVWFDSGSDRITIRKIFDVKRKELTESNFVEILSSVNIL